MKIIYNNIIPFPGYIAINLFGVLFVRNEYKGKISPRIINHEGIHTAQMKELWYIGFYLLYVLEWLYRLVFHTKSAYRGISFEREAYNHENEPRYLETRERFAQWKEKY